MKDIDFIKWLCDKAEGFLWIQMEGFGIIRIDEYDFQINPIGLNDKAYKAVVYPLLLQRAIEGLSKEGEYNIHDNLPYNYRVMIQIGEYEELEHMEPIEGGEFDKAKESALRYIYEQEKGNEPQRIV